MSEFYVIENVAFASGELSIEVAELLEGAADGLVGLPLLVLPASRKHAVRICEVGHFSVSPEPVFVFSSNARKITGFLFEEPTSTYLLEHGWAAATFNLARSKPVDRRMRHFVVHAENFVVNVLSAREPQLQEVARVGA